MAKAAMTIVAFLDAPIFKAMAAIWEARPRWSFFDRSPKLWPKNEKVVAVLMEWCAYHIMYTYVQYIPNDLINWPVLYFPIHWTNRPIFRVFRGVVCVQTWMTVLCSSQVLWIPDALKAGRASTGQASSTWIVSFSHVGSNLGSFSESSSATDRTNKPQHGLI